MAEPKAESLLASPWAPVLDPARRDGRIVASTTEPGRKADPHPLPEDLEPGLVEALERNGIRELYTHQAEAFERAGDENLVITTATASGKSLAFSLPVLNGIEADPKDRALYLYPAKALAQDQARSLTALAPPGLRPAIYDGDTPREERPAIRRNGNLVLTNPDMLHVGILPHHRNWGNFLSNLRWVVVDEAHTYRGVFGSHVANVLRRLRRLAAAYGSEPRFLMASATIANPVGLAEELTGLPFGLIDRDGAPAPSRDIRMWNPPLIDPATGTRRSSLAEGADLLADLTIAGVRTICFLRSRRGIELIHRFARERLLAKGHPELAERIAPYRAGYTPSQRRQIERDLAEGRLLAVSSTNALELGIDIGTLDAAICVTFPGTVAALRQMWGRAGRRQGGLAVYIAGPDGLDQYFCRHPDEFLERPVEAAILDHGSPEIADRHLVAAAYELPLGEDDQRFFGEETLGRSEGLLARGELRRSGKGLVPRRSRFVAGEIPLRSTGAEQVAVVDGESGEMIGTVESARAFRTIHPGAVYMHLGRSWEVEWLDPGSGEALVHAFSDEWYTRPKVESDIFIEAETDTRTVAGVELKFGEVAVTERVTGYQRVLSADQETIDLVPLELPEHEFVTRGLWYTVPPDLAGEQTLEELLGTLHATEHAQIAVLPLIAMCDRWDIGGLSTNLHPQTGEPTVFIYDGHPGGIGLTRRGFDQFERLVADAARLVGECGCEAGCPACVQSPKCGNLNEHLFKSGAARLLARMAQL